MLLLLHKIKIYLRLTTYPEELKNVTFIAQNKDISSFNYLPRLEDNIHYNYFGMKKIGILFSNNFNKLNNNNN